ncbi:MAG: hypothetical protein WB608_04395 [Terracidiphilus sp.]
MLWALLAGQSIAAMAQNPKQFVERAVQTELAADRDDHSRWLYFDFDRRPGNSVKQWVADTGQGSLHRVLVQNGQPVPVDAQRARMDRFIHNPQAQAKQHKSGEHDDEQAEEMLKLLPNAFVWSITSTHNNQTTLHFRPDPDFQAPDWETRVFAAMEGDLTVDNSQLRIVSLKGRLIHDVKFAWGLLGDLKAGGTFDVERRETGPSVWQITETHIHIQGNALLFKDISQIEDEDKSQFKPLPSQISWSEAEAELMKQETTVAAAGR